MKYISIKATLVFYDELQLFIGIDERKAQYICIAVPEENLQNLFLCSAVSPTMLEDYLSSSVDLRYVIKNPKNGHCFTTNLTNQIKGRYLLEKLPRDIPEDWLPEAGFFATNHTEEFKDYSSQSNQTFEIAINGRWDVQDLSYFPNKFADVYSFLHAFEESRPNLIDKVKVLFQRYPWKGGFSAVSFYNDLYHLIPKMDRLAVEEIKYASPGSIKLNANSDIVEDIRKSVLKVISNNDSIKKLYCDLQDGMSERKFLGVSKYDAQPTADDVIFLENSSNKLASSIDFDGLMKIHEYTDQEWVATAKILASYYRRLEDLAEFYDSGKATI